MKQYNNEINSTMNILKSYRHILTVQQYRVLKGQCIAGDFMGARKGLTRLLKRQRNAQGDKSTVSCGNCGQ